MQSVTTLNLNLQYPNYATTMHAVQNDKLTRKVTAFLYDGSTPFIPDQDALGMVRFHKPDDTNGFYDVDENGNTAVTWEGNIVTISLAEQALACAGIVLCQIQFYTESGQRLTTFTWKIDVQECALSDEQIISTDYYSILTAQISAAMSITYRPPYINTDTGHWMTWSVVTNQYEDSGYSAQGTQGDPGLGISSVTKASGTGAPGTTDVYNVILEDDTVAGSFDVYQGANGQAGASVTGLTKVSGTGAGGTVDTYRLDLSNGQSGGTFQVYNGNDGSGSAGSATPLMDGTAAVGSATAYSREDHRHPSDTSRAPTDHASTLGTYGLGSGTEYGHVKLSDATNSESDTGDGVAATPAAVKAAKDYAAPVNHASPATTYGIGNSGNFGHVKLSDSTSSSSDASAGIAASPKAVKAAYDLANSNQGRNLYFSNVAVAANRFASDSTYSGYSYKGSVSLTGVTSTMFAEVVFSPADAISGNYAPICETYNGGVYIWSKVNTAITIPAIAVMR